MDTLINRYAPLGTATTRRYHLARPATQWMWRLNRVVGSAVAADLRGPADPAATDQPAAWYPHRKYRAHPGADVEETEEYESTPGPGELTGAWSPSPDRGEGRLLLPPKRLTTG
jgi:hypothetical protein